MDRGRRPNLTDQIEVTLRTVLAAPITPPPPVLLPAGEVAALIDHTLLKPDAVESAVRQLCAEALAYGFASVCVNPTWVPLCSELLAGGPVRVCAVAGFPLGANAAAVKAFEAAQAVQAGAQEIDMVINVGRLKDGDFDAVYADIAGVVDAVHAHGGLLKVILETGLLTDAEKVAGCVIVQAAGGDFVKTATGFSGGGATPADIALMRAVVGPQIGVKAAGGVRTGADALALIAAGANRIGASAGVRIVQELAGSDAGTPAAAPAGVY